MPRREATLIVRKGAGMAWSKPVTNAISRSHHGKRPLGLSTGP